jgi:hypothetical protein
MKSRGGGTRAELVERPARLRRLVLECLDLGLAVLDGSKELVDLDTLAGCMRGRCGRRRAIGRVPRSGGDHKWRFRARERRARGWVRQRANRRGRCGQRGGRERGRVDRRERLQPGRVGRATPAEPAFTIISSFIRIHKRADVQAVDVRVRSGCGCRYGRRCGRRGRARPRRGGRLERRRLGRVCALDSLFLLPLLRELHIDKLISSMQARRREGADAPVPLRAAPSGRARPART